MADYARYLGFDQHKETVAIAEARAGREREDYLGTVRNREEDIARWLRQRAREWGGLADVLVCYEAGPCGYALYRQMKRLRVACEVIAPSLTPRKPGERIRTDRRDARKLSRLLRAGELTAIWVPDEEHEALRDLVRGREAALEDVLRQRHRLSKLLLRQGKYPPAGLRAWSKAYERWLDTLPWEQPIHQDLMAEMRHAIESAQQRVAHLEGRLAEAVAGSAWAPTVAGLECFRGVELVVAATLVVEVGAAGRFLHPRDLMGYAGLVPGEDSSGESIRRSTTGPGGNHHLRRVLIEAAWAYVHVPKVGRRLAQRQRGQPAEVLAIAWRAQVRLHKRYRQLMARGKERNKVITALARELCGFLWEALQILPMPPAP
jgi:transposase